MTIYGMIMLILPGILHIKGPISTLILLIMNSLINIIMQYSREHMRILGFLIEDGGKVEDHIEQGLSMEESQAIFTENFQARELEEWIPKPIDLGLKISTAINLIAIVVGIVNLVR